MSAHDISPHMLGRIEDVWPITPSDTASLRKSVRGIIVAETGLVQVRMRAGWPVVPVMIAAGIPFPISPVQILETGTTATGIVGFI